MPLAESERSHNTEGLLDRLWIYTNYDCNLSCSYCVAESFVGAERNGLELPQVRRLIDEAVELGMTELFLTGGEPFILHDIFDMIRYGLEHLHVTVLSNGILLKGKRLQQLEALPFRHRLTIQISLEKIATTSMPCANCTAPWESLMTIISPAPWCAAASLRRAWRSCCPRSNRR